MLGYLFRQCADGVPAIRIRRATATMLINESGRVVKLPETCLEGIVLNPSGVVVELGRPKLE